MRKDPITSDIHYDFSGVLMLALLASAGCQTVPLKTVPRSPPLSAQRPADRSQNPERITEITMERDPGMNIHAIAAYTVTLRSDGTATWVGLTFPDSKVARKGTYTATISKSIFRAVSEFIEQSGYFQFDPFYGPAGVTDIPKTTVSIKRLGKRKTVLEAGKAWAPREKDPPKALIDIENDIESALANAKWVKVSNDLVRPNYVPELNTSLP